jgi:hypothetical protein
MKLKPAGLFLSPAGVLYTGKRSLGNKFSKEI